MIQVFISSVQSEFAAERKALCEYIRRDPLLCKFFVPFIFEELPAANHSAQQAYLKEVAQSDIYLLLLGGEYGNEDEEGISPTEREFDVATANHRHRLAFLKRLEHRNPKEKAFVEKVANQLLRKSFDDFADLKTNVYASLIRFLEDNDYLRLSPWDASLNKNATIEDIDPQKVKHFIFLAKEKRRLALNYSEENLLDVLVHLNLATSEGVLTNSALLLFAKDPQRFFVSSEIKCMVFPTAVKAKPILSYQVYRGSIFELVDAAVGFVMQHIDARVGTHDQGAITVEYEIPMSAVHEVIVNAVVHRQFESNGSVEVMLFKDRLEVWNPGQLPYGLTIDSLTQMHNSIPPNPILAHPVYLAGYIERLGTGTTDVVTACAAAGLPMPEFKQDFNAFRSIIWRKCDPQNDPQNIADNEQDVNLERQNDPPNDPPNDPQKIVNVRCRSLLETIISRPMVSKEELARIHGISVPTLKRDLRSMRRSYDIKWVGPTKGGHWEVKPIK